MKAPWQSKTLWLNLVMAISALFIPAVGTWISAHPEALVLIWSGVNIVLRFVTKDKVQIDQA